MRRFTTARPIPGWKPSTPGLGDRSLEELYKEFPVIAIHFWASWNGVDPLMDRGIRKIADRFVDRLKFFSLDVDSHRGVELAKRFGIATVPTLVISKLDSKPTMVVGFGDAEELAERIELRLAPHSAHR